MKELTQDNFKDAISNGVVVVDMYADWCGPCRALTPMLEEMDGKIEGVTFTKLDTDAAMAVGEEKGIVSVPEEFEVVSIPAVFIFKDGKEFNRIIGLRSKQDYETAIRAAVA